MPGQARPQLVDGQPAGEAVELTRMVAQKAAKLVGEPVELAPEAERGFLEQPGRRAQAGRKPPHVIDAALDPTVDGVRQTLGEIVEALRGTSQQIGRIRQTAAQADQPLRQLAELALRAMEHPVIQLGEAMGELGAHRHGKLGGRGRGRRPAIGGVVDQGGVGLMPDRRDQRDHARRRGAHHDLLVERPEILERAAAARDDQQVRARHRARLRQGIEPRDRGGDLLGRELALHHHRPQQHPAREALGQAMQDVPDHGAGRRGDDADHLGQERQGPLAPGIEQALGGELFPPLLEQGHQRTDAGGRQAVDEQLILGPARIGGDAAGRDHLEAVLRLERQAQRGTAPTDRVQAGRIVLEREVAMPRGVLLEAGDLAADPHVAVQVLEGALERGESSLTVYSATLGRSEGLRWSRAMIAQWLEVLSGADPAGWGGGVKVEERARAIAVANQRARRWSSTSGRLMSQEVRSPCSNPIVDSQWRGCPRSLRCAAGGPLPGDLPEPSRRPWLSHGRFAKLARR